MSKKQLYAFLCLIFTLIGGGMVATKFALLSFSPVQIVFMRLLIPACVYAALHKKWLPLPYQRGDWKFFVIIVVCEPCLFFICETLGMMYTSASQGGVIAACLPILMGVAGWIFLKEKPNVQLMFGILLAVIGVAGASWFGSTSEAAPHPLLGNLFMFCSILASSLYAVFTRRLTQRYPVLAIAAIQSIGGALFFLPLNFFFPLPESIHASSVFSVLYLSIMVGLVAYCGFNYSLQQLTAGEVGLFSSLVPIATCLFAFILLGERLSLLQNLFMTMTIIGVIVAALPSRAGRA